MRLRRILITNSHTTNMGDLAILQATVSQLRQLGDMDIIVHSYDAEYAKGRLQLPGVSFHSSLWPNFTGLPSVRDILHFGLVYASNVLSLLIYKASGTLLFSFNKGYRQAFIDLIESDLVIGIGGGYISSDYGMLRPYSDFIFAKALGKRVVLYGQSIGPFHGPIQRILSRAVLGAADLILLRDHRSAQHLREIGLRDFHVTADLAFALPEAERRPRERSLVVFSPRGWRFRDKGASERYLSFLRGLARRVRSLGHDILLLPTAPEDIPFHAMLMEGMPQGTSSITQIHPPGRIIGIMSEADFVISSRMHPIVLASLSGTPFFAIGWEYKLDELSSMLCSSKCSLHGSGLDGSSTQMILERIGHRDELRRQITERLPSVRKEANRNLEIFRQSLDGWGYRPGRRD